MQPRDKKRKLAAFDIDGTLFRSGLYREVFFELVKMGAIPQRTQNQVNEKMRAWRHRVDSNSFEEFEKALVTTVDRQLPKLRIADYDKAAERVVAERAENVYMYTRQLLQRLKSEGYFLAAISGSQIELVEPLARRYGFDTWVGQRWERDVEFFTGNIQKTHTGKDKILQKIIATHNLTLDNSWAIGDSNGDVGMLAMVAHPVAFNPTEELFNQAVKHGWQITVERKNMIYHLEQHGKSYVLAQAD